MSSSAADPSTSSGSPRVESRGDSLREREAIPNQYKWDLTAICADWEAWMRSYRELEGAVDAFKGFRGTLSKGPNQLLDAFRAMDAMGVLSYRVWYFASLHYDQDQDRKTSC